MFFGSSGVRIVLFQILLQLDKAKASVLAHGCKRVMSATSRPAP